jgi:hypothetical protein
MSSSQESAAEALQAYWCLRELKVARLALHSVKDEEKLVPSQMKEEELALELRQGRMVDVCSRWRAVMAQVVNVRKALELLGIPVPKSEHSSPPSPPMLVQDKKEWQWHWQIRRVSTGCFSVLLFPLSLPPGEFSFQIWQSSSPIYLSTFVRLPPWIPPISYIHSSLILSLVFFNCIESLQHPHFFDYLFSLLHWTLTLYSVPSF